MTAAPEILGPWQNFGVMTGGAAAALTGLMFVVMTLISGERVRRNPDGVSVFSTPTVAHFGAVLFVAALLCTPWRTLRFPFALLVLAAVTGLAYVAWIWLRQRRLVTYRPDLEDRMWHVVFPLCAYLGILAGGLLLQFRPGDALFAVAAGVVVLLFVGIHNAWDVVTFVAVYGGNRDEASANVTPPDIDTEKS